MKKNKITKKELIVILLIVGALVYFCLWPLHQVSWKAARPPALEENRIVHPNGFSIIAPDTWRIKLEVIGVPDDYGYEPKKDSISAVPWAKVKRTPCLRVSRWENKAPVYKNFKLDACVKSLLRQRC